MYNPYSDFPVFVCFKFVLFLKPYFLLPSYLSLYLCFSNYLLALPEAHAMCLCSHAFAHRLYLVWNLSRSIFIW